MKPKRSTSIGLVGLFILLLMITTACQTSKYATKEALDGYTQVTLNNGLILLLKEDHSKDKVVMTAGIPLAESDEVIDGRDLNSVNDVLFETAQKGTVRMDENSLKRELAAINAGIGGDWNINYVSYSFTTNSKNFSKGMVLLFDVLKNASFEDSIINASKESDIQALEAKKDDPENLLWDTNRQELYKDIHYGKLETPEDIRKVTRQDVIQQYERYFTADNTVISVTGNFNSKVIIHNIEILSVDMRRGKKQDIKEEPKLREATLTKKLEDNRVDSPIMLISYFIPEIKAENDYVTLSGLSWALSTALFNELRENRQGLSYAPTAWLESSYPYAEFSIHIPTSEESFAEAKEITFAKVENVKKEGFSEQELETLKNGWLAWKRTSGESFEEQSSEAIWKRFSHYGLSNEQEIELIRNLTNEQLIKAANDYLNNPLVLTLEENKSSNPFQI